MSASIPRLWKRVEKCECIRRKELIFLSRVSIVILARMQKIRDDRTRRVVARTTCVWFTMFLWVVSRGRLSVGTSPS